MQFDYKKLLVENGTQLLKKVITPAVIIAVISFFGGVLTYQNKDKDSDTQRIAIKGDDCQSLLEYQSQMIFKLNRRMDSLTDTVTQLRKENTEFKLSQFRVGANQILFNNSIDNLPFPYWVKSREGRMVKLNQAYEDHYLTPIGLTRLDYIDHTDFEVWPEDIARSFRIADLDVVKKKAPIITIEKIRINGKETEAQVMKFPIWYNQDIIGVGGVVYTQFETFNP